MKTFSKVLTFTEYEESKIMCPHCGSHKVEQQVSPFSWDRVNLSASEEDDPARVLSGWESEGAPCPKQSGDFLGSRRLHLNLLNSST
jgi:hypothetical protein